MVIPMPISQKRGICHSGCRFFFFFFCCRPIMAGYWVSLMNSGIFFFFFLVEKKGWNSCHCVDNRWTFAEYLSALNIHRWTKKEMGASSHPHGAQSPRKTSVHSTASLFTALFNSTTNLKWRKAMPILCSKNHHNRTSQIHVLFLQCDFNISQWQNLFSLHRNKNSLVAIADVTTHDLKAQVTQLETWFSLNKVLESSYLAIRKLTVPCGELSAHERELL